MGCQVFLFVSLPGVLRPYRVVYDETAEFVEELPVRFVRGNREVVEGVAPLVIGQRAGAVDAVFLCVFPCICASVPGICRCADPR